MNWARRASQGATTRPGRGRPFPSRPWRLFYKDWLPAVWKSTSASGAPDNSSLSHFSAMTLLISTQATRAADADPACDADSASPKWPADCLLDAGAPRLALTLALADAGASPLERLHGLANAADVLDAWALKARDDARARAALAAGLRHGADPDALAAALRGFDGRGRGGPLVQRTLERLALTSERVEALFSR